MRADRTRGCAAANRGDLAAVEGVDVVFVGTMDLSQSLGFPGDTDAPAVTRAVDGALARIVASGKVAGTSGRPEVAQGRLERGVRYHYTHVTALMGNAAKPYLEAATLFR